MAKHGRAQITIRKGYGVAGTERYIVKNTAIFSQRDFAFRATIQIIEDDSREPPLCHASQIMDVHDMRRADRRHSHSLQ
jgi:hypothetical protein